MDPLGKGKLSFPKKTHPKNPWTLQWKGLNLYSRGPGPQNSQAFEGSGFLGRSFSPQTIHRFNRRFVIFTENSNMQTPEHTFKEQHGMLGRSRNQAGNHRFLEILRKGMLASQEVIRKCQKRKHGTGWNWYIWYCTLRGVSYFRPWCFCLKFT